MNKPLDQIEDEVLRLSEQSRAKLMERLLLSFREEPDSAEESIAQAWVEEAERRDQDEQRQRTGHPRRGGIPQATLLSPMKGATFNRLAEQELAEAVEFYEGERLGLCEELLDEVDHAVIFLGQYPEAAPRVGREARRFVLPRSLTL